MIATRTKLKFNCITIQSKKIRYKHDTNGRSDLLKSNLKYLELGFVREIRFKYYNVFLKYRRWERKNTFQTQINYIK